MKLFKTYHPYAFFTILCWSLAYVLTRLAHQHFSAFSIGFLRYVIASAILLVVAVRRKMKLPDKRDIPTIIGAGVTGFFLYMVTFNIGTGYVTAATSSVIIASVPVITALMAAFFFRERLKAYQWLAIAIEFAGIIYLTVYQSVFSLNWGTLWLLLAALMLSSYNLIQRKLTGRYPAMEATVYSLLVGAMLLTVFARGAVAEARTAPVHQLVYILLMGVFSSAAGYLAWSRALELAEKTSQVSNYMFFTPFITGVLGFVMAGEVPEPSIWIGGACIILGALLFNRESFRGGKTGAME